MAQIGFGKHRHRTWEDVVDKDHQYVEWALEKLDVNRFNIPEHILDLYLDKFRNDTKAKLLVKEWRRRCESRGVRAPEHDLNARRLTPEEVMATPVNSIESTIAFEHACLDAFGKFPFNRWDY